MRRDRHDVAPVTSWAISLRTYRAVVRSVSLALSPDGSARSALFRGPSCIRTSAGSAVIVRAAAARARDENGAERKIFSDPALAYHPIPTAEDALGDELATKRVYRATVKAYEDSSRNGGYAGERL